MDPDPARRRLFLAIALDTETREVLATHLEAQGLSSWPGRLVPPQNWHITLRFLGWTDAPQADQILRSLDEATLPPPFTIRFGGLGAFPRPRRATVVWIGVDRGIDQMTGLAAAAEAAAQGAGFRPEDRPFHAHLTLSRVRPPVDVRSRIDAFEPLELRMGVASITLFESHLARGGTRYEPLDEVEL